MKHLKSFRALAIVAGVCLAFTSKSGSLTQGRFATRTYSYNLSTSTGAKNAANWTLVPGSLPNCGIPGDVPCRVSFDSSVYPTLQDYIDDQNFLNDSDVVSGPGVTSKQ